MKQAVAERVQAEKALEDTLRRDGEVESAALAMWTHLAHNNFGPRFTEALKEKKRR